MKRIALIGLGTMGSGIAANLIKGGYDCMYIIDKRRRLRSLFLKEQYGGIAVCRASRAEMVIAVVVRCSIKGGFGFGPDGGIAAPQPGTFVVECRHALTRMGARTSRGCAG